MNRVILPAFLAMCASGLVVAASWDVLPGDGGGSLTALISRHVPALTATGMPVMPVVGDAVAARVKARGDTRNLTYAVVSGKLPPGLDLAADGRITGVLAEAGRWSATVSASDGGGNASSLAVALDVLPALPDLVVEMSGLPVPGTRFVATVRAPAGSGIVGWSLDEGPSWLAVTGSGDTATVSGQVPGTPGSVSFVVAGTDASGRSVLAGSGDIGGTTVGTENVGGVDASAMALPPG